MDINQARLLAQPDPTTTGTAKIFSRVEAAEMARASVALFHSGTPEDIDLGEAAHRAVEEWLDANPNP